MMKKIRDLLRDKLTHDHFSVITTFSGKKAPIVAKEEKPDLILLDIAMPEVDGYMTCEKLQSDKVTRKIPVVFLTGKDLEFQSIIEHCQNLSAAGCISKMSTMKEFSVEIRKFLPKN
ncbi:MAG: response regulator [Candidatus Omnitrophica bacterium]|nr:response regulator [Candidatus Omnitrophota bacterium]